MYIPTFEVTVVSGITSAALFWYMVLSTSLHMRAVRQTIGMALIVNVKIKVVICGQRSSVELTIQRISLEWKINGSTHYKCIRIVLHITTPVNHTLSNMQLSHSA